MNRLNLKLSIAYLLGICLLLAGGRFSSGKREGRKAGEGGRKEDDAEITPASGAEDRQGTNPRGHHSWHFQKKSRMAKRNMKSRRRSMDARAISSSLPMAN